MGKVKTIEQALGDAIRKSRLELGISQEQLAFISGLHRTYIGSVERGERNISLKNLVAIATALKMKSVVELFSLAGI